MIRNTLVASSLPLAMILLAAVSLRSVPMSSATEPEAEIAGNPNAAMMLPVREGHGVAAKEAEAVDAVLARGRAAANEHSHEPKRQLAPSKPMSALHFVKPKRYLMHSGETTRVSLTLVAPQAVERVMVTARSNPGTELVSKPQFFLGSMEPWQEITVWFDVTVLAEGRHYVSVVAHAETPAGPRLTSYSVAVEALLGTQPKRSPATPAVYDAQGNLLKLMPATDPGLDAVRR